MTRDFRGPYCDDEMRRWWVAAEDMGYLEARREVKATCQSDLYWDQKLVYVGKQTDVHLWDGDGCTCPTDDDGYHDAGDCVGTDKCRHTAAWAFEVVER
jgi:hypothetical protein